MDTTTIKRINEEYYKPWNQIDHITDFGIRLDEEQEHLANNKIEILEKDKLQFYIKQMYASQIFEYREMKTWEKKVEADEDIKAAKDYFEEIFEDNTTPAANSIG